MLGQKARGQVEWGGLLEPILETPDMDLGRRARKSPQEGTLSEQSAEGSVTRSQAAEMAER